jgi:hypothetical protein
VVLAHFGARSDGTQRGGIEGADGLALEGGRLVGGLGQDLLFIGAQLVPELLADEEGPDAVDVVGNDRVLLDLVELGGDQSRQRVFLAVNRPGLQSGIDLGEGHRQGVGAERLEGVDEQRVLDDAQLQAAYILSLVDRVPVVADLAEAVFPKAESDQSLFRQLRHQLLASGPRGRPAARRLPERN